jgi:hypothetical protein
MPRPRRSVRAVAVLVSVSAVLVAGACDRSDDPWDGEVAISVDLDSGQQWTASGAPVDRGQFCPSGSRHVLRGIEPMTGETVRVHVWFGIMEKAITTRNSRTITFVVEHTCADGSGSFVTREQWGPDVWSVESGTGAYRDLTGGGELSFATLDYMVIAPLQLRLDGALAG